MEPRGLCDLCNLYHGGGLCENQVYQMRVDGALSYFADFHEAFDALVTAHGDFEVPKLSFSHGDGGRIMIFQDGRWGYNSPNNVNEPIIRYP